MNFSERIPNKPGWYWAMKKTLSEPEVVNLHFFSDGKYLIVVGSETLCNPSDYTWGPKLQEPVEIDCPNCSIDINYCNDYENRTCSRCQGTKKINHVRASESHTN